jgi:hypothetical protein
MNRVVDLSGTAVPQVRLLQAGYIARVSLTGAGLAAQALGMLPESGFADRYFSRVFRRLRGSSPAAFRRVRA